MGYRRMTVAILRNIYRRWESGQNLSEIERVEQVTRKTVRAYVQQFQNAEESDLSCSPPADISRLFPYFTDKVTILGQL